MPYRLQIKRVLFFTLILLAQMPLAAKKKPQVPDSLRTITVEVQGVPITMQRVEGGSYVMGATADQYDPDTYTNKPAHLVFLSPFYIATTEVTNRLWRVIMPERETLSPSGYPMHPVSFVNWNEAREFVRRLDSLTGFAFRLPTEAEWEYAARGGEKSKHYRFAGSNTIDSVGWTYSNAGQWTHPVGSKQPNELGLYDMTGNVAEWCNDRYAPYQLAAVPDPCGADTGSQRIVRGASYDEVKANSHLSVRKWYVPETSAGYIGFRVAFTLPNDPCAATVLAGGAGAVEEEETLPLTQNIRVKGRKLRLSLVAGEDPYYISDEISTAMWKKIMTLSPPEDNNGLAVGMSSQERLRFADICSRHANRPLTVATAAETDSALVKGIIVPPKQKQSKKTVRETQQSRRVRGKMSPWAELVGVKLSRPEDVVLQQYRSSADDDKPLRLVIKVKTEK